MSDRDFAKQVAKQLDRRRFRRRLLMAAVLVTAVVLGLLYLTCGDGFGLGGKGKGSGSGAGSSTPALHRCAVRVSAAGLELDGKPSTKDAVVAGCKDGADITVTGDAREGDWTALHDALEAAKIPFYEKRR